MDHTAVSATQASSLTLYSWQHGAKMNYSKFKAFKMVVKTKNIYDPSGTKYIKHWFENDSIPIINFWFLRLPLLISKDQKENLRKNLYIHGHVFVMDCKQYFLSSLFKTIHNERKTMITVSVLTTQTDLYSQESRLYNYENLPMQYTRIFLSPVKIENFMRKISIFFHLFAQNIDCGYTLEPPRRGGSNEYPQSMFWRKNKKNRYTPANPSFTI